jgi:arginine utilization protein RocB
MDKKDIFGFFLDIKNKYDIDSPEMTILFENYEISKLDINRIYRYLEKYTKENVDELNDDLSDEEMLD